MNDTTPTKLVQTVSGNAWTTSLIIAETFGRKHKNVLRSIEGLITDGTIDRLSVEPISYIDDMNREQPAIRLDEEGFLIAMPYIGGPKSREGQRRLVKAFLSLRNGLLQKLNYRLHCIETALYHDHPKWPIIQAAREAGLSHREITQHTGHKSPDTIRRNLRRMALYGVDQRLLLPPAGNARSPSTPSTKRRQHDMKPTYNQEMAA